MKSTMVSGVGNGWQIGWQVAAQALIERPSQRRGWTDGWTTLTRKGMRAPAGQWGLDLVGEMTDSGKREEVRGA
jgi:hypothetical protein